MNDHRPDETVVESAIDREIKGALSVDPSPEFLARVRTHVANGPTPTAWRFPWLLTAACAAAATIVIAVVVSRSSPPAVQTPDVSGPVRAVSTDGSAPRPSPAPLPSEAEKAPDVAALGDVASRTTAVASGSVVSGSGLTEPEILIDPGEARALRRLLEGVRVGRIDVATLPSESPQVMTTIQPLGEIAPIPAIEPLGQVAPAEGAQQ